jgi:hypothetical protein
MANRNRVIYQSEALFVGPTGGVSTYTLGAGYTTGTLAQLHRVQNANYSFNVSRENVNQFGQLAALDRVILTQPTVSLDFSYYTTTGTNESNLGLYINPTGLNAPSGALINIMQGINDVKNYYILVAPEGSDVNTNTSITGSSSTIGIGNGFLSSYSLDASVGSFVTSSANVEAYNMRFYTTASGEVPTINPIDGNNVTAKYFQISGISTGSFISVLKPGDITVDVSGDIGLVAGDLKVQSVSMKLDLTREDIQKLGSKFAFAKPLKFPLTTTMTIDATLGDIEADNLATLVNADCSTYNLAVTLKGASCGVTSTKQALKFFFKGAKLDSQSITSSIGANKAVNLQFSAQIGGPTDSNNGIFIEGTEAGF